MNKHAIIHTDGGARGNPGPAGIGVVIEFGKEKKTYKEFIGVATNNEAEYRAVILALQKAKELGLGELDIFMDSELVANQLSQKFKIKNQDLGKYFIQIWNLSLGFKKIKYHHIYREDNKEADRLVNQAIDKGD